MTRCQDCGDPLFFNHHVASMGGDLPEGVTRYSHGDCDSAHEALVNLPRIYDLSVQSNVEASELIGRFLCQSDDETWNDADALQVVLLAAYAAVCEGVRAETRWRESR